MDVTKTRTLGALAVIALGAVAAGTANAALVTITGGSSITTSNSGAQTNNVLGAGYVMQDNAVLATTGPNARIEYFFLGSESGWTNTLVTPFGSHAESDGYPGVWPGNALFSGVQAAAGAVDLKFSSSGFAGFLTQGGGNASRSIAFAFLDPGCLGAGTMVGKSTCVSSSEVRDALGRAYVLFALDDSGAGPDDNHDDYVGYMRVSQVPLPAAVWLLGSGLLGLFAVGRRRKALAIA